MSRPALIGGLLVESDHQVQFEDSDWFRLWQADVQRRLESLHPGVGKRESTTVERSRQGRVELTLQEASGRVVRQ